jgi:mRNA-degrading endonuclease HigB of HigAB toxin-antitoxin module
MQNKLHESLRKIIQQEIAAALHEDSSQFKVGEIYRDKSGVEYQITTMPDKFKGKWGAGTLNVWVTNLDTDEKHFMPVTMLKDLKQVYVTPTAGRKMLGRFESVNEGPEEMGAYRRLVITSSELEKMKTEMTKFMNRADIKSMYPVRFKMIDSPKPNTVVVDVEGDKATVVATKLSDLAKKLDKSVTIMVRKERKLK